MLEEAKNWLEQALRDIRTAENSHKSRDYYASVFFSHQATEKALKALHIQKHRKGIQTHNLVRLGKKLEVSSGLLSELRKLSPAYTLTRYPNAAGGPSNELYDKPQAKSSLSTAKKVIKWIKKQLKE